MKIFSSLFHSRDKPKNSTAGSAYRFYMGGSTAGKNVTERSAMQITAVYSCVRVLSEAVAGLPLHVYKYRSDGDNMDVAAVCPKRGMDAAHHRHSLSSRISWHVFKDISLLLSALLFNCQGTEPELKRCNVSG